MSLRANTLKSVLSMLVQHVVNFLSIFLITTLVVRSIPRSEYGELALVLSYGVIFNFLNVSASNILLRDYPKMTAEEAAEHVSSFYTFNLYKNTATILISLAIGFFLQYKYESPLLLVLLAFSTAGIICQNYMDPMKMMLSVTFRQHLITEVVLITSFFNLIITFGVLLIPTAVFVAFKNFLVALLTMLLFWYFFRKIWSFKIRIRPRAHMKLLMKNLSGFSLWSHFQGVLTDVIYRSDVLILGWLNTPFQVLGNYNVALQLSNTTIVVPQTVQYHTTLGVSNMQERKRQHEVVHLFMKVNLLFSIALMVGYVVLGKFLISIIAKTHYDEIFQYGLYILGGLCLFNTFRPLIAYSSVIHSIKECVLQVNLPTTIFAVIAYFVGGVWKGVYGVLVANVLIAAVLSALTVIYMKRKTDFEWDLSPVTEYEKALFKEAMSKMLGRIHRSV